LISTKLKHNPDHLTKDILAEILQICSKLTLEGQRYVGFLRSQIFLKIFIFLKCLYTYFLLPLPVLTQILSESVVEVELAPLHAMIIFESIMLLVLTFCTVEFVSALLFGVPRFIIWILYKQCPFIVCDYGNHDAVHVLLCQGWCNMKYNILDSSYF
jgi:hypothetical protein